MLKPYRYLILQSVCHINEAIIIRGITLSRLMFVKAFLHLRPYLQDFTLLQRTMLNRCLETYYRIPRFFKKSKLLPLAAHYVTYWLDETNTKSLLNGRVNVSDWGAGLRRFQIPASCRYALLTSTN